MMRLFLCWKITLASLYSLYLSFSFHFLLSFTASSFDGSFLKFRSTSTRLRERKVHFEGESVWGGGAEVSKGMCVFVCVCRLSSSCSTPISFLFRFRLPHYFRPFPPPFLCIIVFLLHRLHVIHTSNPTHCCCCCSLSVSLKTYALKLVIFCLFSRCCW